MHCWGTTTRKHGVHYGKAGVRREQERKQASHKDSVCTHERSEGRGNEGPSRKGKKEKGEKDQ